MISWRNGKTPYVKYLMWLSEYYKIEDDTWNLDFEPTEEYCWNIIIEILAWDCLYEAP